MRRVDPATLLEQPLMLRKIGDDDYAVAVAGLALGRIMKSSRGHGRVMWFWTLTGPYVPLSMYPTSGDVASLDQAKTAIKAAFDLWLRWAKGQGEVVWHTPQEKIEGLRPL